MGWAWVSGTAGGSRNRAGACFSALLAMQILGALGCKNSGGSASADTTGSSSTGEPLDTTTGASDDGPGGSTGTSASTVGSIGTEDASGTATDTGSPGCGDAAQVGATCFAPWQPLVVGRPTAALATGDLDNDGASDVVAGHIDGISTLLGNGAGSFSPALDTPSAPIAAIAAGFLDSDETLDVVTAHGDDDRIEIRHGLGDGTLGDPIVVTLSASPEVPIGPRALVLADVDDDARNDVIVANELAGTVVVLRQGDADAFFADPPIPVGGTPLGLVAGGFAAPLGIDLAVGNFAASSIAVLIGQADGSFDVGTSTAVGGGPRGLATADLDGDGRDDIVCANGEAGTVSVLIQTATDFASPVTYAVGAQPRAVAIADFDNDGTMDIAVAVEHADAVAVLTQNGMGVGALETDLVITGASPGALAAADFNGDQIADLVTASAAGDGGIALLLSAPG